jgi:nucleotide-binding universal stress UspA family protein
MLDRVLAPLDGSSVAEAGLSWARHAAGRCDAAVDLFTVVDDGLSDADSHVARARQYLESRGGDIEASGLTANLEVVTGSPAERILNRAADAKLTVMTYGTKRWLFGGALDLMLQNMNRPVVVVRARTGQPPESSNGLKVLVPLDKAPYSCDALPEAQMVAEALGASTIVLCHVVAPVGPHLDAATAPPGVAGVIEDLMEAAGSFLSGVAKQVTRQGIEVETVVAMGDFSQEIVALAERSQANLIAMATRGTQGLSRVMGSVAYGVLQFSRVPCLLVRPAKVS